MAGNKLFILYFISFTSLLSCKNQADPNVNHITKKGINNKPELSENKKPKSSDTLNQLPNPNPESQLPSSADQPVESETVETSAVPGPKGYVGKNNVTLFKDQNTHSPKITTLQKGSTIYLLETSMINEKGELSNYPTWYKIQTKDKKTGWVEGSDIHFGH
jgi:glucan-binding YG repeat protein